jgi:hypothetical protein
MHSPAQLCFAALTIATSVQAAEQHLTIDGFKLGLPKEQAEKLHPEAQWRSTGNLVKLLQKEFTAQYLGEPARIKITLDPSGRIVQSIGVIVAAKDRDTCTKAASNGLAHLEKTLGKSSELTSSPLSRAVWSDGYSSTTMWFNSCSNQPPEYVVTHTRAGL